jgi:hypothetical protein
MKQQIKIISPCMQATAVDRAHVRPPPVQDFPQHPQLAATLAGDPQPPHHHFSAQGMFVMPPSPSVLCPFRFAQLHKQRHPVQHAAGEQIKQSKQSEGEEYIRQC